MRIGCAGSEVRLCGLWTPIMMAIRRICWTRCTTHLWAT